MDIETLLSYDWYSMMPEFIILGVATLITLLDLFLPKTFQRKFLGWIGAIGIVVALGFLFDVMDAPNTSILFDTFYLDSFSKAFKLILLVGTLVIMVLAATSESRDGMELYRGEYYYLLLAALLGTMFVASSTDMITLFVGIELLTISSYIMVGLQKKDKKSNEAALKYVINGGIATAVTLFGLSYIYGITGTTNLRDMAEQLMFINQSQMQYMLAIAFIMVFVGVSFKLASVPYHMWAPDVYEGAPTVVTAFLSTISKIAGFVFLVRIMFSVFSFVPAVDDKSIPLILDAQTIILFVAALTMIVGNVIALRQRNVKRMFAYSSIAHAGYVLVAFGSMSSLMFESIWFYLLVYLFMNIGAFAVIHYISEKEGSADISKFAGLYKKSPMMAVMMGIFLLSLAGIPGTGGFIGKVNIVLGALMNEPSHYWAVAVLVGTTIISYFYYFGVFIQMFFRPAEHQEKLPKNYGLWAVVTVCAVATLVLGILPNLSLDYLHETFGLFQDFNQ